MIGKILVFTIVFIIVVKPDSIKTSGDLDNGLDVIKKTAILNRFRRDDAFQVKSILFGSFLSFLCCSSSL
jgi:hypothetical protein